MVCIGKCRFDLVRVGRGLGVGVVFDAAAFDLGAGKDFFLPGLQQLVFGAAQAAQAPEEQRAAITSGIGSAIPIIKGVPAQVLVEIERQEALLAAELRWLDSLLTRLDGGTLSWGPDAFDHSDRYLAQRKAAQQ